MKFKVMIFLLATGIYVYADEPSARFNMPNLMMLYSSLESDHAKLQGNHIPFFAIAGVISDYVDIENEPEKKKCASHVLSLIYQMGLTTSSEKRVEYIDRFSDKLVDCDHLIPGFVCGNAQV